MSRDRNGVKFPVNTAKRLLTAGRYVEQQPRNSVPVPRRPVEYAGGVMLKLTTDLGRMSGATPGTGSGKIQKFDGTSYSDFSATAYKILNDTTAKWLSGAYVFCIPGYGYFHAVNTSCSNVVM